MSPTIHLSCVIRKPAFRICENKGADKLYSSYETDQRLCFRYMDSAIPLLTKFKECSHFLCMCLYSLVCVEPGQNPKDRFCRDVAHIALEGLTIVKMKVN